MTPRWYRLVAVTMSAAGWIAVAVIMLLRR
jgi:hypothetical protein